MGEQTIVNAFESTNVLYEVVTGNKIDQIKKIGNRVA